MAQFFESAFSFSRSFFATAATALFFLHLWPTMAFHAVIAPMTVVNSPRRVTSYPFGTQYALSTSTVAATRTATTTVEETCRTTMSSSTRSSRIRFPGITTLSQPENKGNYNPDWMVVIQMQVSDTWNSGTTTVVQLATTAAQRTDAIWQQITTSATTFVSEFWWTWPLLLCVLPASALWQQPITTPFFWKMIRLEYILQSPDALPVVSFFLLSNIAYGWAAAHVLQQLPPRRQRHALTKLQERQEAPQKIRQMLKVPSPPICRYSALGWWILTAGVVSTVFHSVQALGPNLWAEALCYLDHGIAGAAVMYFWHMCGPPQGLYTLTLAAAGMTCLAFPFPPGYVWLHAVWHVLSAATAVLWIQQGKPERRRQLWQARRQRLQQQQQKVLNEQQAEPQKQY